MTFTVNSTTDAVDAAPGDGVCATAIGDCTLRAVIQETNALAGPDTIFLLAAIYALTISGRHEDAAATGDLDIADDLTVYGAGPAMTIIDGNALDRLFDIAGGFTVNISGVTVQHGNFTGFYQARGGGILNGGVLNLRDSAISDNTSRFGGGIYNFGTLNLNNSTISVNTAGSNCGGLYTYTGGSGGGVMTVTNSTIANNSAGDRGGGIAASGSMTVNFSTISGNFAEDGGGGIFSFTLSGIVTLQNSVLAMNTRWERGVETRCDCRGQRIISGGNNLLGDRTGCYFAPTPSDMLGTADSPIDPLLGPLEDNGGRTFTVALLEDSPAIDAIPLEDCADAFGDPITTDQRGVPRPLDGDGDGIALCDIGAYELEPPTIPVEIDIKPGSCPNSWNRESNGVLPVAILGTEDFDVNEIDVSSVTISRADGAGGSVGPHEGPPGPHSVFEDVGTPFEGEECDCHEVEGDGILDLSLKFRTQDVADLLPVDDPSGALVPLVVSGTLLDGKPFISSSDCVRLVPPGSPPNQVTVQSASGSWVEATPLDNNLDGGGFGSFQRTYPHTTVLTLKGPSSHNGNPFVGWRLDAGDLVQGRSLTLVVNNAEHTARAVFKKANGCGLGFELAFLVPPLMWLHGRRRRTRV